MASTINPTNSTTGLSGVGSGFIGVANHQAGNQSVITQNSGSNPQKATNWHKSLIAAKHK